MKTPFDNWFVIFSEYPNYSFVNNEKLVAYTINLKHKYIPNFSFIKTEYYKKNDFSYMDLFSKIYSEIYLASKFSKAQNIINEDSLKQICAWDEDKKEWYILDEQNNKKYESEFPQIYRGGN